MQNSTLSPMELFVQRNEEISSEFDYYKMLVYMQYTLMQST